MEKKNYTIKTLKEKDKLLVTSKFILFSQCFHKSLWPMFRIVRTKNPILLCFEQMEFHCTLSKHLTFGRLIDCMVCNAVFNSISVISRRPMHLSMLPVVPSISTPHNILSMPLADFPHSHCRNNDQR